MLFRSGQVIEYLGRYTHKIAISNHRLQSINDGKVSFTYKDYHDGAKTKVMTLTATEFLRRFCLHILPKGFRKIRHYGILASTNKPKLKVIQKEMDIPQVELPERLSKKEQDDTDGKQCPCCKKGRMQVIFVFRANAPPWLVSRHVPNRASLAANM